MALQMKPAEEIAIPYGKTLIYGDTKTGKTTFAARIALGMVELMAKAKDKGVRAKAKLPIYIFDTEKKFAAAYQEVLKPAGAKVEIAESRSLSDVRDFMRLAEEKASFAVIDQVSHIWRGVLVNYLKKRNEARKKKADERGWRFVPQDRLYMPDWAIIKPTWVEYFDDPFLLSEVHMLQVSRKKNVFEEELEDDDKDKKNLIKVGTAPQTETNSSYEALIIIEMIKELNPRFESNPKKESKWSRFAQINGDNLHALDGVVLEDPKFKDLVPHFSRLSLGAKSNKQTQATDDALFMDKGSGDYEKNQRQSKVYSENIKDALVRIFPGTGEKEKAKKTTILKALAGFSSWSKWESMHPNALEFFDLCVQELERRHAAFHKLIGTKDKKEMSADERAVVELWEFKNLADLERSVARIAADLRKDKPVEAPPADS